MERTLLLGSAAQAAHIRRWLLGKEVYGLRAVGILCTDTVCGTEVAGFQYLGAMADLEEVVRRETVTQVIVLELPQELQQHQRLVAVLEKLGVRLLILSNLEELLEHPVVHIEE